MHARPLLTMVAFGSAVIAGTASSGTIMAWFSANCFANVPGTVHCPPSESWWEERIANFSKHRENITAISPTIHGITAQGTFGEHHLPPHDYNLIAPYLPRFQALGLEVHPIIGLDGGMPGLQNLLRPATSKAFIKAAITKALEMNYTGYNVDVESRGAFSEASWVYLKPYAQPFLNFLNSFADAMHAENKTLTMDIAGCCGWVDPNRTNPAGHCLGAFATHEFVGETCPMLKQSRVDRIYAMSTYSDSIWNNPISGKRYGPEVLKQMIAAEKAALGDDKYGYGFKGGWNLQSFEELSEAKETIRYLREQLGVRHSAHWCDEARNEIQWEAWGFLMHGDNSTARQVAYV